MGVLGTLGHIRGVAGPWSMAYHPFTTVLRRIRRLALAPGSVGPQDGELLERFLSQHDEAAFELLVRRHGPMVLGVCRRILRDPHDSDDAFQATFLVLLCKARSLGRRDLLANWLYGVAYRTALKARTAAARRRARERQVAARPAAEPVAEPLWGDFRAVLDEEVQRLPAKYRLPVVLCCLEEKTLTEAARELGWPAGTVSGRLARARELLRTRLTRRGIALSAGLAGSLLAEPAAAVPTALVNETMTLAMTLMKPQAAAGAMISTRVADLMKGVLQTMFLTKLKMAAFFVGMVILAGGAGVFLYPQLAAQPPSEQRPLDKPGAAEAEPEINWKAQDKALSKTESVRVEAIVVPRGETQILRLKTKKTIAAVKNQQDAIAKVEPNLTDPGAVWVMGRAPGVSRLVLTDVDGKVERLLVVVEDEEKRRPGVGVNDPLATPRRPNKFEGALDEPPRVEVKDPLAAPLRLAPGTRAMAVKVSAEDLVGGFLVPGSHVDIIQSTPLDKGGTEAKIVLEKILVLAVDTHDNRTEKGDKPWFRSTTVTLQLSPEQATKLVKIKQDGTISFAIRAIDSGKEPERSPARP